MIGKTTKETKVVFPVYEGEIINEKVAYGLLNGFLKKVSTSSKPFGFSALFSVPCGSTYEVLEKYRKVAKSCGARKVSFVEAPLLSALGQRIPLSNSTPFFVIDMAGGVTNIAAVSLEGVIAGLSVNIGANKICTDIIDYLVDKYGMQIGLLSAESLKNEIGSLEENDALSLVVNGRNIHTGAPMSLSIRSMDILEPIKNYYDKIADLIMAVLSKLPPEVSAEIRSSGINISGISSHIYGLEKYYGQKFDINVNVAENGKMCVALGGAVALGDSALLKKLELKQN